MYAKSITHNTTVRLTAQLEGAHQPVPIYSFNDACLNGIKNSCNDAVSADWYEQAMQNGVALNAGSGEIPTPSFEDPTDELGRVSQGFGDHSSAPKKP